MWSTYDKVLDPWTENFIVADSGQEDKLSRNVIANKYDSMFTYTSEAPVKALACPEIEMFRDTIIDDFRHLSVRITSKRRAQRIDVFANPEYRFKDFSLNGVDTYKLNAGSYAFENRSNSRLISYYITDNEPLELMFTIPKAQNKTFNL